MWTQPKRYARSRRLLLIAHQRFLAGERALARFGALYALPKSQLQLANPKDECSSSRWYSGGLGLGRDRGRAQLHGNASRDERHQRAAVEPGNPAARLLVQQRGKPAPDDRGHPFCRVEHGVIGGRAACPEVVSGSGWKEGVNLAPREINRDQRRGKPATRNLSKYHD